MAGAYRFLPVNINIYRKKYSRKNTTLFLVKKKSLLKCLHESNLVISKSFIYFFAGKHDTTYRFLVKFMIVCYCIENFVLVTLTSVSSSENLGMCRYEKHVQREII